MTAAPHPASGDSSFVRLAQNDTFLYVSWVSCFRSCQSSPSAAARAFVATCPPALRRATPHPRPESARRAASTTATPAASNPVWPSSHRCIARASVVAPSPAATAADLDARRSAVRSVPAIARHTALQAATRQGTIMSTPPVTPRLTPGLTPRLNPGLNPRVTCRVTPRATPAVTRLFVPEVVRRFSPGVTRQVVPLITRGFIPQVVAGFTPGITPRFTPRVITGVTGGVTPPVTRGTLMSVPRLAFWWSQPCVVLT